MMKALFSVAIIILIISFLFQYWYVSMPILLLIIIVSIVRSIKGRYASASLYQIDNMDGHEFEYLVAELMRKSGYSRVVVTPGSGDYGVDVIAYRGGLKYVAQCKRYKSNISLSAVQEIYAAKSHFRADVAAVITNQYFTDPAKNLARSTGVLLWDRDVLRSLLGKRDKGEHRENVYHSNSETSSKTSVKRVLMIGAIIITSLLLFFCLMLVVGYASTKDQELVNVCSAITCMLMFVWLLVFRSLVVSPKDKRRRKGQANIGVVLDAEINTETDIVDDENMIDIGSREQQKPMDENEHTIHESDDMDKNVKTSQRKDNIKKKTEYEYFTFSDIDEVKKRDPQKWDIQGTKHRIEKCPNCNRNVSTADVMCPYCNEAL